MWKKTLAILLISTTQAMAADPDEPSAKALFYSDPIVAACTNCADTKPPPDTKTSRKPPPKPPGKNFLGVSYHVVLKRDDGTTTEVVSTRTFHSGDHFQLALKVNRPVYVYVANTGSSGRVSQLFPTQGQDNFIDAMGTVFLPAHGYFQFDGQPGTEIMDVLVTTVPVMAAQVATWQTVKPDVTATAIQQASYKQCSANGSAASKDISIGNDTDTGCAPEAASKDIVSMEDANPPPGQSPQRYDVKFISDPQSSFHVRIPLNHQ